MMIALWKTILLLGRRTYGLPFVSILVWKATISRECAGSLCTGMKLPEESTSTEKTTLRFKFVEHGKSAKVQHRFPEVPG